MIVDILPDNYWAWEDKIPLLYELGLINDDCEYAIQEYSCKCGWQGEPDRDILTGVLQCPRCGSDALTGVKK